LFSWASTSTSGAAPGLRNAVVLEEDVLVERVDLGDWRLVHEVEHVGPGAADADDGDPLADERLGEHDDAGPSRGAVLVDEG
jgi:hypothetical protein